MFRHVGEARNCRTQTTLIGSVFLFTYPLLYIYRLYSQQTCLFLYRLNCVTGVPSRRDLSPLHGHDNLEPCPLFLPLYISISVLFVSSGAELAVRGSAFFPVSTPRDRREMLHTL